MPSRRAILKVHQVVVLDAALLGSMGVAGTLSSHIYIFTLDFALRLQLNVALGIQVLLTV